MSKQEGWDARTPHDDTLRSFPQERLATVARSEGSGQHRDSTWGPLPYREAGEVAAPDPNAERGPGTDDARLLEQLAGGMRSLDDWLPAVGRPAWRVLFVLTFLLAPLLSVVLALGHWVLTCAGLTEYGTSTSKATSRAVAQTPEAWLAAWIGLVTMLVLLLAAGASS